MAQVEQLAHLQIPFKTFSTHAGFLQKRAYLFKALTTSTTLQSFIAPTSCLFLLSYRIAKDLATKKLEHFHKVEKLSLSVPFNIILLPVNL